MLDIDELVEGILENLETAVAPSVSDPRARAQLFADIDLLANLAAKVEWKGSLLRDECESLRGALEKASTRIAGAARVPAELSELSLSVEKLTEAGGDDQGKGSIDWFERRRCYAGVFEQLVRAVEMHRSGNSDVAELLEGLRSDLREHLINQTVRDAFYLKPMRINEMSKG